MSNSIKCPCCGAEIEIEARQVQAELALGPIEIHARHSAKNRLDEKSAALSKIEPARTEPTSGSRPPTRRESNRIESGIESTIAPCGEDLIESLKQLLGTQEWITNGALWRWRIEHHQRAVQYAIEDYKVRTPDDRRKIRNRGAWLTDKFKRAVRAINEAEQQRKSA